MAEFIVRDMESLLVQFEESAASLLPAGQHLTPDELRDDAQNLLQAVAKDLSMAQFREEQAASFKGIVIIKAPATTAQTHALLRARNGFSITQRAAVFRALRNSVLRVWTDACHPDESHLDEVIRFNEAIDQALAESIAAFAAQIEQARHLLVGVLGHDMHSPLSTSEKAA